MVVRLPQLIAGEVVSAKDKMETLIPGEIRELIFPETDRQGIAFPGIAFRRHFLPAWPG